MAGNTDYQVLSDQFNCSLVFEHLGLLHGVGSLSFVCEAQRAAAGMFFLLMGEQERNKVNPHRTQMK